MSQEHRNTIFVEDAVLDEVREFAGEQFIIRLEAPKTAANAQPGTFVHLTCDSALPMRRPLSLMRVDAKRGWIDILYKTHGLGLTALSKQPPGTALSVMGPIGKPFVPSRERPITLLIGGGVGIPPMIYLAEALKDDPNSNWQTMMFMGSELPFPFALVEGRIELPHMPSDATHSLALVEEWGIPSRLASKSDIDGAHDGYVTDLARAWLEQQDASTLAQCEIFSCGPTPMLKAVAALAQEFNVTCKVSLEEYMACAVGGCAGCVVPVHGSDGAVAMKRVCVDGPVFEAAQIYPTAAP
ncbi:MAG: dihydroorotate dehydrogenase electron transfer subunit [Pseudomonadota bacterium]